MPANLQCNKENGLHILCPVSDLPLKRQPRTDGMLRHPVTSDNGRYRTFFKTLKRMFNNE